MPKRLGITLALIVGAVVTAAVVVSALYLRAGGDGRADTAGREEVAAGGAAPPAVPARAPRAAERATPPVAPAEARPRHDEAASAPAGAASAPDDDALMEKLRALAGKDPQQILQLARAANARDPNGPHAAERAWMVVKSLTDLERYSEAKDEAQTMVNRYPGTSWSMDVQRHLLSNPL
jgi:hypothetical protein